LFITDSPRTPPGFLDAVGQALQSPHRLAHHGTADATLAYPALLALSDRLVVTADSAAMKAG
ncbi:MAG: ELM1/GtrOC1 family putative glycosyltransferase, partial [Paracoccaceae bacterium]|nr:ELM1/GtrOC1 family putative glycosyltransferase [Paracoccaceae bacterium]